MRSTRIILDDLLQELSDLDANAFAYRDSAIRYLQLMSEKGSSASSKERDIWTSGLGRIIDDDGRFMDSPLAKRLLGFSNEYRRSGLLE
jgi:hypothetical protein